MAGLAQTTPRAQPTPRLPNLRAHLGGYLVGIGATSALTAGAVVVFLSMAAFVAFNGLPSLGGSSHDAGGAYLSSDGSTPTAAAAALGAARDAVAKDPVSGAHRGSGSFGDVSRAGSSGGGFSAGTEASRGGGSSGGGSTGPGGGSIGPGVPGATPPPGSGTPIPSAPTPPSVPSVPDPPGGVNPPPIDVPSVPNPPSVPSVPDRPSIPSVPNVPNLPSTSGPVAGAVQRVDDAAGTNLSGPTSGVTRAVDGATTRTLNQAGSLLGG
jgi:hypothetical protein